MDILLDIVLIASPLAVGISLSTLNTPLLPKIVAWISCLLISIYYVYRVIKGGVEKGALTRAGITRRLRPYDLMHYFITKAMEKGGDIKALSEVVESKPETIMRHYQHVTTALYRKTVSKIHPLPSPTSPTNKPSK